MHFPYLWVDATYVPCRRGGLGATASVVTAIAVGKDGVSRIVRFVCVDSESYASWKGFLRGLRERRLFGVQRMTPDAHGGIVRAVRELFPDAAWQRCVVHLERDVIDACPTLTKRAAAGKVLHAVFDEVDPVRVRVLYQAARGAISKISADAGRVMKGAEADALAYLDFPEAHRRRIRTDNVQERCNREIKRRTRVVRSAPSEEALIRLVSTVCCRRPRTGRSAGTWSRPRQRGCGSARLRPPPSRPGSRSRGRG